jgi:hypothetical protein
MANHVAAHVVCSFDCLWGRMSTRPNTDLASIIEASVEASVDASVEPRHGSIEARHGSVEEATKHPGTQARNGQRKQDRIRAIEASSIEATSSQVTNDKTELVIEATIEATNDRSKHGSQASNVDATQHLPRFYYRSEHGSQDRSKYRTEAWKYRSDIRAIDASSIEASNEALRHSSKHRSE